MSMVDTPPAIAAQQTGASAPAASRMSLDKPSTPPTRYSTSSSDSAPRIRPAAAIASRALLIATVLLLGFFAYIGPLSDVEQHRTQKNLADNFAATLAGAVAPIGGQIEPGTAIAVLDIPALDIQQVVVEGTSSEELAKGPGHRRDTPLPGQAGVSVISGRRTAFGGPFNKLEQISVGTEILVTTGQGIHRYRVEGMRRPGDPLPQPTNGGRLTLVTTDPPLVPSEAIYVDAALQSDIKPAPAGRAGAIAESERTAKGDPRVLVPLVLWTQLFLLVGLIAAWASQRWGAWQTYLTAAPIFVAVLWNVYANVASLLPNTL